MPLFSSCKMSMVSILILLVLSAKRSRGADDNGVYNPCVTLGRLKMKDGISLGVGMVNGISSWYNNSDVNSNLLSPCSSQSAAQLPLAARTSVFRPVIEQIGQFELDNASYVELRRNFTGDASLVVFAGRNPTVISKPRFFLYADGRVPELTLDIHFEEGKLIHLIWKEDDCAACYAKNQLCRDGSCVTRETDCQSADTTNSTITDYNCRLMIIITFSGVDRYSQLLTTWYQITHINRYSMASIFNALERQIQEGLERLDRSG
ncbi:hypothetical protein GOP47_0026122 [Adiantum capillus-veneris]|uniref:Uncharacterized protein n=1 Tax=Adiantum capillus-veneris TaxID=13818 RepID=A0A9D4U1R0_ADICA|nr:hypothetical protein GOP47_0026122 [Adiantum capillus-veneris]